MVSLSEIDAYQGGAATADFAVKVANTARNAACGLYGVYPKSIIPNPVDSFVRGLWDSFCANSSTSLPSPPVPPFSGGQCSFNYNFTLIATDTATSTVVDARNFTNRVGPLVGFRKTGGPSTYNWFFDYNGGASSLSLGSYGSTVVWSVDTLAPSGGGADSCGDPPADWPDQSTIPPGGNESTGSITLVDGTNIPVNLTVNIPTGGINFTPNITLDISPDISILGDVNVNFNLGGISINPPGAGVTPPDLEDLRTKIGNDRKIPAPPPDSTTHDIDPPDPDGDGGDKSDKVNLDYVKITLTTIPDSARVQFGTGGSPNVYIGAGWIEFKSGEYSYPRESINFEESFFKAPEGCDGYAYTLAVGFQGYDEAFRRKATT